MRTILFIALAFTAFGFAQPKTEEATFHTSAECNECKERIESKLNYTKGIVFAELKVDTQMLTVKYKPTKITLPEIKALVSELGYDAAEVKANPEQQKALPACCQPGAMKH